MIYFSAASAGSTHASGEIVNYHHRICIEVDQFVADLLNQAITKSGRNPAYAMLRPCTPVYERS